MDVLTAIQERRSVRAFLAKPVSREVIIKIFETARFAPSGVNHQPWNVLILNEAMREKLAQVIVEKREANIPENPDYNYYPTLWFEPYKTRRKKCGKDLYQSLHIAYEDKEARKQQWYKNYYFFGAPIAMIFYIHKDLSTGSWMDFGGFLQTVMIAARSYEIETCPQAALAEYPDVVRELCGIDQNYKIVCGMALGYADWNNPVNQYRTEREAVNTFIKWT
ncbi:MAG TPA: nitroreductase [Gammaproteobacteria bacterium]|nr:nitroreductase [Gammaproteobacteria bacterium]